MSESSSLARCVGDPDRFLSEHFGRAPFRWSGPPPDDLLSLTDVDRLLGEGALRWPAVRVVRDGEAIERARWTRQAVMGSVTVDDLVDARRLLDLYADGCTIVLQSLHRWWPPLAGFCREMELVLDHAVQANAYLSPAGASGLAPHHDTHDVFVLQVHGSKQWTVRAPVVESPLPRHVSERARAQATEVLFETELHTGDCLYLPRGFVHSASAQAASSLHVTIGVRATTAHDVVRHVASLAADDPELRHALPVGWASDPAIATAAVEAALAELVRFTSTLDATQVGAHLAERRRRARPAPSTGRLVQLDALAGLDDDHVVHLPADRSAVVTVEGGRARIDLADRRLDLPATLAPALERLLDHAPHRVGELDDLLDGPSRKVLVRRLVRDGCVDLLPAGDG